MKKPQKAKVVRGYQPGPLTNEERLTMLCALSAAEIDHKIAELRLRKAALLKRALGDGTHAKVRNLVIISIREPGRASGHWRYDARKLEKYFSNELLSKCRTWVAGCASSGGLTLNKKSVERIQNDPQSFPM